MYTGFDPEGRCLDSKQDWEGLLFLAWGLFSDCAWGSWEQPQGSRCWSFEPVFGF